ncbi:gluconokinase [Niabella beijingensis]|uniref:gluconokinase n=1 Tax=Niabella beijingensis TaxID=2872700 RepID=UPI001CC11B42|nr:gluconokinase [Niabella beijingensis]MBZ4190258.1 gluconokinase [Niabella beijingensis]
MQDQRIIIMGVSGSGKTTVGKALAAARGYRFIDGDDLHPPGNIEKMRNGIPLTDEDRWEWLERIGNEMAEINEEGVTAVAACSALRKRYRDVLRHNSAVMVFIYLKGTFEQIHQLLATRKGHFMPVKLLESQFAALEEPAKDEADCYAIPLSDLKEELDQVNAVLTRNGFL